MFGKGKIKLDKALLDRASTYAAQAGYASVQEFITHIIEREIAKSDTDNESEEKMEKRLKGLGYIS